VEKAVVERGRRRRRKKRKTRVTDQTADMMEQASMPSNIYLSDPEGRDETVV
jgi:hypothetical protein